MSEESPILNDLELKLVTQEEDATQGELTSEQRVRFMANVADAIKASDIVVLDLRELTIIADFFLICTGNSSIQIRSIADRIEEKMREIGYRKLRSEGYQEATWILLDYSDVVVHVMAEEQREFFGLELFWDKAPRLELELLPETATSRVTLADLLPDDDEA